MIIHIVGLGVAERASLSANAEKALLAADRVIGSARQLATLDHMNLDAAKYQDLPVFSSLKSTVSVLQELDLQSIAILASGDPLYYGIGRWFSQQYPLNELRFYPAVSSIQAACHALGLSLQDMQVISLHGRPMATIRRALKPNQSLLILTDKHSSPAVLAGECITAGFAQSTITVCERLGYANETIHRFDALELMKNDHDFDPLHVTVIEPKGLGGVLPSFPGFPDEIFITGAAAGKGMLSKRDVRLSILSFLQPAKGDCIWDIGAGCGGVAVELAYWQDDAKIVAIEHNDARLDCLRANQEKFGVVDNLEIIEGRAPDALAELPVPNKVFIGGSDGELPALLKTCWALLPVQGLLVATAVTEDTKIGLHEFRSKRLSLGDARCESKQIAISQGDTLAGSLCYKPSLTVTLFCFQKGSA